MNVRQLLLLTLAVAGGTALVTFGVLRSLEQKESAAAQEAARRRLAPMPETAPKGKLIELEDFGAKMTSLKNENFLRLVITVELHPDVTEMIFNRRIQQARNRILEYLSSLAYDATRGTENRELIRSTLMRLFTEIYGPYWVQKVYFTEFTVM